MKKIKLLLGILILAAFVASFALPAFGAALSPIESTWLGQWFKLTSSSSGYYYPDLKGGISSYKVKSTMYLRIDDVNDLNKRVSLTQCNYNGVDLQCETGGFNYIGDNPNPLDFLVYESFCNDEGGGEVYCMSYTARIKGKLNKTGVLTSGSIKCIGAMESNVPSRVGKMTFSGILVPVSKLPFPEPPIPR